MKHKITVIGFMLIAAAATALSQGKFSGYMFGDYYYNVGRDANPANLTGSIASPAGGQNYSAFQLRRIYFTYDNDISEQFTTRFRLEADQAATTSSASGTNDELASGKVAPFVKDAYLTWKNIFSGSNLTFGVQPTPAYDVSETAWGYRSIEKTIGDLRGLVSSRDLGVSLKGKITADGMFNYWLMWGNGSANGPESDLYKRYYAHIQVKPTANLQATIYADFKDASGFKTAGYNGGSDLAASAWTEAVFVGYTEPFAYNIGAEIYLQSTTNGLKDTLSRSYSSKSTMGISVFGSYTILPELAVVARYDNYNPSTDNLGTEAAHVTAAVANANLSRNYIIAGLSWKVDKNVSIQPNVLYETYQSMANGYTPDPSVTARVTFYYIFL
jgi:hypothetical protein